MTGRNDQCPCGSGKKYKNCCALKPAASASQTLFPFASRVLQEKVAFQLLLIGSEPFRRYYLEVRPQLSDFVVVHDPNLPVGVRARTTRVDGTAYLRLRTPVCPVEHASLIAHELGHLLLDTQDFPAVGGLHDHPAAAALNSALHDPLIDAALEGRGFDLAADRVAEIKRNMRQLERRPAPPVDVAGEAHWIANSLGYLLDRHVLGDDLSRSEFIEWFAVRYPSIADQARRVAAEVISIGFDTPVKMFAALEAARTMLNAGEGVIGPPRFPLARA